MAEYTPMGGGGTHLDVLAVFDDLLDDHLDLQLPHPADITLLTVEISTLRTGGYLDRRVFIFFPRTTDKLVKSSN